MDHRQLIKNIKSGQLENIYFLHGEEPYFIEEITNAILENALEEHERDFNQIVIYGKDAEPLSLISELKNYPMMAARKLVILKEAQDFKHFDYLEGYCEAPSPTTIFVVNYKYKAFDSRKKIMKSILKNGIVFKSDKVKEYLLNDWIQQTVKGKGFAISSKATMLLAEFLGNDLGRIVNEIDKLSILIEKGTTINEVHIEENIGISKDYNVYELTNAVAQNNFQKAFKIVDYFNHNPKATSIVMVIPNLFKLFSQMMRIHFVPNKSKDGVASYLKIHPFVAGELLAATKHFNPKKIAANIEVLHEYDLKSKGIGSTGAVSEGELMKEMVFRLLH